MAVILNRPVANFSPSLWGDRFLNHIPPHSQVLREYSNSVEALKTEVRSLLTDPESKMIDTMILIDTLERLGVSYHFEDDIEHTLQRFFDLTTDYYHGAYDLYTVALHFRLFRQHGHPLSSDIFGKWRDVNGEFQESLKGDAKGLLSLYEASYLRTRGETILDDALAFTTASLKSMAPNLGSPLKKQVDHALGQPLHLGIPRVEARSFISWYEEEDNKNEMLLKFAKLDFNLVQMQHQEELQQVSRWWKDLDLISKLPYARDRIVECFFWAIGVFYQPQYSRMRIIVAKVIAMTSVIDDTYDSYGTVEELDIFTEAIQRWDYGEIARLPEYMRPLYKALLELYEQFEEELTKEGRSYAAHYSLEGLKEMVRSYNVEAKWLIEGHIPSFEEYRNIALITCTYCYLPISSLMGIQSVVEEDFKWLSEKPKMLMASLELCRFIDDVATYEVEKDRGQVATSIECYMKENGVTKEEAIAKFWEICTNALKDSNEECLRPSCYKSRDILTCVFNFERLAYVFYKNEDGYTHPEKVMKPNIVAMLVDPIPLED